MIELNDIAAELEDAERNTEADPERTVEVQERLNLIYTLQRKHQVAMAQADRSRWDAKILLQTMRQVDITGIALEANTGAPLVVLREQEHALQTEDDGLGQVVPVLGIGEGGPVGRAGQVAEVEPDGRRVLGAQQVPLPGVGAEVEGPRPRHHLLEHQHRGPLADGGVDLRAVLLAPVVGGDAAGRGGGVPVAVQRDHHGVRALPGHQFLHRADGVHRFTAAVAEVLGGGEDRGLGAGAGL